MDIPKTLSNVGANQHLDICQSPLTFDSINIIVIVCSVLAFLWAIYNFLMVRKIDLEQQTEDDGQQGNSDMTTQQKRFLLELSYKISDGSMQYLKQQYIFCIIALALVFPLVWFLTEKGLTTAIALLAGGFINMVLTLLSLIIANQSNYRIAYSAKFGTGEVFRTIHKASCAIGFGVCSISVLALIFLIDIMIEVQGLDHHSANPNYYRGLFEAVAGYALGTSLVSIFTRVSGGVFAASTEFGADFVGKMQGGMPYKNSHNPATVAEIGGQSIGQLLGGIAEFTSAFAQAICVVFILTCTSLNGYNGTVTCGYFISNLMYPVMAIALGLFFAVAVSSIVTNFIWIQLVNEGQSIMRLQLLITTLLMFGSLYLAAYLTFPSFFTVSNIYQRYYDVQQPWIPYLCSVIGITSAVILCIFNYFFTSSSFFPIQSLVESSRSSSAANLANGLALGYISTIVPIVIIATAIYFSNMLLSFYGVGLAVIGVLSGMPIFLIHHIFGPLADNAYNIALLLDLGDQVRQKTEQMDSIGKSSTARTRAFTIQPAALLGIALFGGYLFNVKLHEIVSQDIISITKPLVFSGVLLGAMIPFFFSGIILPAVRDIGLELSDNVAQQLRADEGILQGNTEADYASASGVVGFGSLISSIIPISIALLFPLALGFSFGIRVIAGYLIGIVISGIQFALSGINSGQAWQSTRKMIGSGSVTDEQGRVIGHDSECYKTSLIGEQVGSSLQKTASIPLSVIIKLSGIVCVVFGSRILQIRG